jgi:hypothetical protein
VGIYIPHRQEHYIDATLIFEMISRSAIAGKKREILKSCKMKWLGTGKTMLRINGIKLKDIRKNKKF